MVRAARPSAPVEHPGDDELLARRGDYPILARTSYLVSNSLGAMHRETAASLAAFAALWAEQGVAAWETWFPRMREVADTIGEIIGAPAGSTVLRQNVSDAMVAVASTLDFGPTRNRVVVTALDWPGTTHLFRAWERYGAELVVVPADPGGLTVDPQRVADAVDDRTALVSLSLVAYRSGALLDPEPAIERAHRVGARVCLDAYQAVAAVPFDVTGLAVDFCVGGSVKYLCGGPGNGWLYVRPDVAANARPAAVGWLSADQPFSFADDRLEYGAGSLRYTGGTPGVPAAYAAVPGFRAVRDVGVARIRRRSLQLTGILIEEADRHAIPVRTPREANRRGGHVTLAVPDGARVAEQLRRLGILVDHRPDAGIRLGPHFYSTESECREAVAAIAELAG
jgi:kynureninase